MTTSEQSTLDGSRSSSPHEKPSRASSAKSWTSTIALAVGLTILLRMTLFQAYSIPSPSMVPTLNVGDRVLVWYASKHPSRGDIIVFNRPPLNPKMSADEPDVLIKRVIGLPGETVTAVDGVVYIDGNRLEESYLPDGTQTIIDAPITVPSDEYLVLGDNRLQSVDGRRFGTISQELIVGRAVLRIWPPNRLGGL